MRPLKLPPTRSLWEEEMEVAKTRKKAMISILSLVTIVVAAIAIATSVLPPSITDENNYGTPPPWPVFSVATGAAAFFRSVANKLSPPPFQVFDIAFTLNRAVSLYSCAKAGIYDHMPRSGEPKSVLELSRLTGLEPHMTRRLVRACSSLGSLRDVTDTHRTKSDNDDDDDDVHEVHRLYQLTPMGDILRDDHPYSARPTLLHLMEDNAPGLLKLFEGVKDTTKMPFALGHPEAKLKHNANCIWEYLKQKPEQQTQFNRAMSGLDSLGVSALASDFPWAEECETIIDIGGGRGTLLHELLRAAPHAEGALYDLPEVVDHAKRDSPLLQMRDRSVSFHGGSFFEADSIPVIRSRRACYVTKVVLHDWDDKSVQSIVGNVARVMKPGDLFVVLEVIQRTPEPDSLRTMLDIHMLSIGGRERTVKEFTALFEPLGLEFSSFSPTRSMYSIAAFVKGRSMH